MKFLIKLINIFLSWFSIKKAAIIPPTTVIIEAIAAGQKYKIANCRKIWRNHRK